MGILEIALIIFIIVVVLSSAIGFYIHNKDDKKNDKFDHPRKILYYNLIRILKNVNPIREDYIFRFFYFFYKLLYW